ncbi:DNA replication/repair protein RecF [Colwelliaceae bacterium 6471]
MSVCKLITHNFRNLVGATIDFHPDTNFIVGDNGSGKSSILEAIFYLGHGKSFRTSNVSNVVTNNFSKFVVSIQDEKCKQLGISRDSVTGDTEIKIDGQKQSRLSELAKNIAVQIITPESFKLFSGGPKERRRFLDLGLFHVKHDFSGHWRDFAKVLRQRNACLKNRDNIATLEYWDQAFCKHADIVSDYRHHYVSALVAEVRIWIDVLLPKISSEVEINYIRGWNSKRTLAQILSENRDRELSFGYSLFGPHKFDVKILFDKQPIESVLSRGQQKLFLLALTFAQAKLIEKVNQVKPILLIDDVGAELDINSRSLLSTAIDKLNCQVIITAIDKIVLEPFVPTNKNYKMFHVKHGDISVMSEC